MVLCMTRPTKHPKSGVYRARVVVPKVLRPVVGKRELIPTLGTKDPTEAKRLHPAALARLEAILAAARVEASGKAPRLSVREIDALAREVYRRAVEAAEEESGSMAMHEAIRTALVDRLEWGPR